MCDKIQINNSLYNLLQKIPIESPLQLQTLVDSQNDNQIIIKEQSINTQEAIILNIITDKMINGRMPLLFPFLYGNYVFDNTLYIVHKKCIGPSLSDEMKKPHDTMWWCCVLYQIAKAIWYLQSSNITVNNLSPETICFQLNLDLNNCNNIAIMITDFSKSNLHSNNYDLEQFINNLLEKWASYMPKDVVEILILCKQQKLTNQHESFGKIVTQAIGLRFSITSDKCSLDSYNKINGVSIGALFGNIYGMPLKLAKNYILPNIPVAPIKSSYYSCSESCIKVSGVFTEPIYHSIAIIHNQVTPLNLYTLGSMWVYALEYYKIGTSQNIIDTLNALYQNTNGYLLQAHIFIALLTFEMLNNTKIRGSIEKVLNNYFKETIFEEKYKHCKKPEFVDNLDSVLDIVIWTLKNEELTDNVWINSIKTTASVPGLTDLTCCIVGSLVGALYGYKNVIPVQWGFTITSESVKYNRNTSLSNFKEIISNFVYC